MLCCLSAGLAGALFCLTDAELVIHVVVEAVMTSPETENADLFPSGQQVEGVCSVEAWVLLLPLL